MRAFVGVLNHSVVMSLDDLSVALLENLAGGGVSLEYWILFSD